MRNLTILLTSFIFMLATLGLQAQNSATPKTLSEEEFNSIRSTLCNYVAISTMNGLKIEDLNKTILEGLGLSLSADNSAQIISDFLNQNKQKLICPRNKTQVQSRDMHLYKRALLKGAMGLFHDLLLKEEYAIDFNGYELVDGKKETVLDYLDMLIEGDIDNTEELMMLRIDIEARGGKRGSEL